MSARSLALLALGLAIGSPAAATGRTSMPPTLRSLKPHEVVEAIIAQEKALGLSEAQVAQLQAWHLKVRDEKHRFEHLGGKPHATRHVPMISRELAYDSSVAVLTAEQREALSRILTTPVANPKKVSRAIAPLTRKP